MASVDGSTPAGLADVNVYTAPVPKEDKHRGVLVGTPGDSRGVSPTYPPIPRLEGMPKSISQHKKGTQCSLRQTGLMLSTLVFIEANRGTLKSHHYQMRLWLIAKGITE